MTVLPWTAALPRKTATFTLRRRLACSPQQAWALLTDPDQMNRWSSARIDLVDPGAGGRPDTAGALRTVTLPGGRARLKEVIERSERPARLDYRVHDGGPALLHHRGRQRIDADESGCTVTWSVDLRLVSTAATHLVARTIRRQVGESLDALSALEPPAADDVPAPAPPPAETDLIALRDQAVAVLQAQRDIADRLSTADDPKQWFARVYSYVTEAMIDACDAPSDLDHPDWVLRLIPVFDEYYRRNLDAYCAGSAASGPSVTGAACTPAWQRAWSLCERVDLDHPHVPVMRGLLAGVSAHIDDDLPQAIARVHADHYAEFDLRAFRPDYLRLAPVFTVASDRLLRDLPRSHKPWWTGVAARIDPQVRDALLARQGYDVARHRLRAFAAAVDLVSSSPDFSD